MKKGIALILAAAMMLALFTGITIAYTEQEKKTADALYSLGLFLGYGLDENGDPVYGLDYSVNRALLSAAPTAHREHHM